MNKIVIFASGSGSNTEKIIQHFKNSTQVSIAGIFCNNLHAKVLERAKNHSIPFYTFTKEELNSAFVLNILKEIQPNLIVLAGFLLKFPELIVKEFPNKIINIHPALLPKYGGKGMYGMHVHRAVLENNEVETGITIHYVNEHYDEGAIISQHKVTIKDCKSPEDIAHKVHELEHEYFSTTIEKLITNH